MWLTDRLAKCIFYIQPKDVGTANELVVTKKQVFLPSEFFTLPYRRKIELLIMGATGIIKLEHAEPWYKKIFRRHSKGEYQINPQEWIDLFFKED